jgi:hypothetical protein
MLFRCLWAVGSPVTAIAFVSLASIGAQSQAPSNAPSAMTASNPTRTAKPPRGQNGRPDLEGVWNFSTITPLQRPQELAEKEFLTDEDAAALEQRAAESRVERAPTPADLGGHNQFWNDRGTKVAATMRTSLIVDPPDGKLPALTPEGQKRAAAVAEAERRSAGPEDFLVYVRCILGFNAGPPIIPGPYNNFVEIIQTADHVVIHNEMVHDARIVPLDGRPHGKIRQWMGDSRGRWEGDTLVIDTINFNQQGTGMILVRPPTDENLRLVERFSRPDVDTLLYEFTIDDPTIWTRPWTAVVPMTRSDAHIYEYACHEGNYAMANMLSAARAREKKE